MAEIEEIKALFGTEALTYDQFNEKLTAAGSGKINLANLASGGYVSLDRHNREVEDAKKAATPADYETLKQKAAFEQKYNDLVAENTKRDRLAAVKDVEKAGAAVKAEFAEFVLSEVEKDPDSAKDFDAALKKYVASHPQYTAKTKGVVRVGSGVKEQGGDTETKSGKGFFTNFIMDNK